MNSTVSNSNCLLCDKADLQEDVKIQGAVGPYEKAPPERRAESAVLRNYQISFKAAPSII
jgi:hypothetical protein